MPGAVLPGVQMFTEALWEENPERAAYLWEMTCSEVCGAPGHLLMLAGSMDEVVPGLSCQGLDPANPQKYLLWQDPLMGQFDADSQGMGYRAFYGQKGGGAGRDTGECIRRSSGRAALGTCIGLFLEVKSEMGIQAKQCYGHQTRRIAGIEKGDRRGGLATPYCDVCFA